MAWTLEKTALRGGQYQGILANRGNGSTTPPELTAEHEGAEVGTLTISPIEDAENQHMVTLHLPVTLLAEGVQTVVIRDRATGDIMDSIAIVAGVEPPEDIRVEVDLMRAELELLKRAFRRHMSDLA